LKLYTAFVDTAILGFLRKGKCFWTTQGFFGMLPHNGILPVEIDLDNLFSVEVRGQLNLLFITPAIKYRNPDVGARRAVPRLGEASPAPTIDMFNCLRNNIARTPLSGIS